MEWRIEESIYGVQSERRNIFSAGGPSPEVPQSENEGKQRAKNIEDGGALVPVLAEGLFLQYRVRLSLSETVLQKV